MRIHRDGKNQICITWAQAPGAGGEKRAWVQHRTGDDDWAGTGRYINVVRVDNGRPSGNPTDFPIKLSCIVTDREALIAFVLSTFSATGNAPSSDIVDES